MDLLAFLTGLVTGLAFCALLLQRLGAARARVSAALALERDAQMQLVLARERHAAEAQALRAELDGIDAAHAEQSEALRSRFAVEVGELRRAVRQARSDAARASDIEQLVKRVCASVERVERELRRLDRGRPRKPQRRVAAERR